MISSSSMKKVVGFLALITVMVPSFAFAYSAGFVFDFKHQLTSKNYCTMGPDVKIQLEVASKSKAGSNYPIKVTLYRKGIVFDDKLSTQSYPSDIGKSTTKTWSGVGKATYYFIMNKENDGVTYRGTGRIFD